MDARIGYGRKTVLDGVSVSFALARIIAVIGHNGAGKSTLLRALFGLLSLDVGALVVCGERMNRWTPELALRRGVAYVPSGNRVFGQLSVRDNLDMIGSVWDAKQVSDMRCERTIEWFPELRRVLSERAGNLSGGEKQMIALAMGLLRDPRFLLLDEPALGLSGVVWTRLAGLLMHLRDSRELCVIVVEQKVREILTVADRVVVLRGGGVSFDGAAGELRNNEELLKRVYL